VTNIQTSIEAGIPSDPFPPRISQQRRQELLGTCKRGLSCPHAIHTHRSSGTTTWKPDPVNIGLARAAFAALDGQSEGDFNYWVPNLRALCGDRWSLNAKQLALARRLRIIDKLPHMTEDEIDDVNKGDVLFKFLAVSQILWLYIQLVTRVSRKLPTTQLEVVTLAFAVISIITYVLLYSRPKDVQTTREMHAARYPTPAELTRIAAVGPETLGRRRRDFSIPNSVEQSDDADHSLGSITAALIVFGGLHLLAWNYEFPTPIERRLWQASAIVTIATTPTLWLLAKAIESIAVDFSNMIATYFLRMFITIILSIFVAARLFIVVEIIRSLAYQPSETFRTTWAANVPHVG
jgi:hypothetical protein